MMKRVARVCALILGTLGMMCSCVRNEHEQDAMLMNVGEFKEYFASITAEYKNILFTELDSMVIGYQNTKNINNQANVILAKIDSFPLYNSNIMDYITALLTGNYSFFATAFSHVPHGRLDVDIKNNTTHYEPYVPVSNAGKLVLNAIVGKDSTYTAIFEADQLFTVQVDTTSVTLAHNIKVSLYNRKGTLDKEKKCMEMKYCMDIDDNEHKAVVSAEVDIIGDRHFSIDVQVDESQLVFNISNTVTNIELFSGKYIMVGKNLLSSMFSTAIEQKVLVRHIQLDCFEKKLKLDIDVDNFFSKITPNKDKLLSIVLQFFIQGADKWKGTTSSVLNSCFGVDNFVSIFNDMNIMISTPYHFGYTNPIARIKLSTEYTEDDYVVTYVVCNDYSICPLSKIPMFSYENIYKFSAGVLNKYINLILKQ